MKKAILKAVKYHSIQTLVLWLVIWLVACFIGWNMYNPLELFIRIPYENNGYRTILIFFISIYTFISVGIRIDMYTEKKDEKK